MRPILVFALIAVALSASAPAMAGAAPTPPAPRAAPDNAAPDENAAPAENAAPGRRGAPAPGAAAGAPPAGRAPITAETLLERLKKAEDEREARGIERQIREIWMRSGSPTADILVERSGKAMEAEDLDTAEMLLAKLTELSPTFAEGWHMRAAVSVQKEDFEAAVTSLRQVLALQPKHFVALAELGGILQDFGDKEHALAAFRQAHEINPFIEGVEERIRELTRAVEGQGI